MDATKESGIDRAILEDLKDLPIAQPSHGVQFIDALGPDHGCGRVFNLAFVYATALFDDETFYSYCSPHGFVFRVPQAANQVVYHRRATLSELRFLLFPKILRRVDGKPYRRRQRLPEDANYLWWLAQLAHYGLQFCFTKRDARRSFQIAMIKQTISIPPHRLELENRLRNEYLQMESKKAQQIDQATAAAVCRSRSLDDSDSDASGSNEALNFTAVSVPMSEKARGKLRAIASPKPSDSGLGSQSAASDMAISSPAQLPPNTCLDQEHAMFYLEDSRASSPSVVDIEVSIPAREPSHNFDSVHEDETSSSEIDNDSTDSHEDDSGSFEPQTSNTSYSSSSSEINSGDELDDSAFNVAGPSNGPCPRKKRSKKTRDHKAKGDTPASHGRRVGENIVHFPKQNIQTPSKAKLLQKGAQDLRCANGQIGSSVIEISDSDSSSSGSDESYHTDSFHNLDSNRKLATRSKMSIDNNAPNCKPNNTAQSKKKEKREDHSSKKEKKDHEVEKVVNRASSDSPSTANLTYTDKQTGIESALDTSSSAKISKTKLFTPNPVLLQRPNGTSAVKLDSAQSTATLKTNHRKSKIPNSQPLPQIVPTVKSSPLAPDHPKCKNNSSKGNISEKSLEILAPKLQKVSPGQGGAKSSPNSSMSTGKSSQKNSENQNDCANHPPKHSTGGQKRTKSKNIKDNPPCFIVKAPDHIINSAATESVRQDGKLSERELMVQHRRNKHKRHFTGGVFFPLGPDEPLDPDSARRRQELDEKILQGLKNSQLRMQEKQGRQGKTTSDTASISKPTIVSESRNPGIPIDLEYFQAAETVKSAPTPLSKPAEPGSSQNSANSLPCSKETSVPRKKKRLFNIFDIEDSSAEDIIKASDPNEHGKRKHRMSEIENDIQGPPSKKFKEKDDENSKIKSWSTEPGANIQRTINNVNTLSSIQSNQKQKSVTSGKNKVNSQFFVPELPYEEPPPLRSASFQNPDHRGRTSSPSQHRNPFF